MRLPSGQKNLLAFALVAGFGFVLTLYLVPSAPTELPVSEDPMLEGTDVYESPTVPALESPPTPASDDGDGGASDEGYRRYALPLAEVRGLSPASPPGSRVQLWVSWEPPITKHPRVQRLRGTAIVDEVLEPTIPEGPVAVALLIPKDGLPDFLFAHKYGSLSAVTIP